MIITFIAGFALGLMVALILNETLDKLNTSKKNAERVTVNEMPVQKL